MPTRFALGLVAVLWGSLAAAAEVTTVEEMVRGLERPPLTRSLSVRKIGVLAPKPAIDLKIAFAYDSADLLPEGAGLLDRLGQALAHPRLTGDRFLIGGHTDAKGSDDYNRRLSERRAEAVRRYLVERAGIGPERLLAQGFGETRLADPSRPEDGINRRVEIVNETVPN